MNRILSCLILMLSAGFAIAGDEAPWPVAVPNFVAPQPGEHPRLFFRKTDIPALRKKAETPEGKAILDRLTVLLGGNNLALPEKYNETKKGYSTNAGASPIGTWTLGHMDGYGLFYVLTGKAEYAELAKQCVEKALDGQRDRDDRYAFNPPSSEIRAGPALMAMAIAYDLCYDGWDEAFRTKVALEIQNFKKRGDKPGSSHLNMSLEQLCLKPNMSPGSNHFPPQIGGAVISVLAIKGDPGTDNALLEKYQAGAENGVVRLLTEGWGDHGYFAEGQVGPGGMNNNFVPALQALRVAAGKDYISPRPNAQWVTLHHVFQLMKKGDACFSPLRTKAGGSYGTEHLGRKNLSHGGQFGQGLGALANDDERAALLWVYTTFVEPGEVADLKGKEDYGPNDIALKAGEKSYDAVLYPQRGVLAFINWPIGMTPKNPGDVLPHAIFDSIHNYLACRNQWKDENDILVTALLGKGPGGPYKVSGGPVKVWGLGMKIDLGGIGGVAATAPPELAKSGSASVSFPDKDGSPRGLAVDFSKASGAECVVVLIGDGKPVDTKGPGGTAKSTAITLGGKPAVVLTLQSGAAPEVKAAGDSVTIGGQTVSWKDGKLVLAKTD